MGEEATTLLCVLDKNLVPIGVLTDAVNVQRQRRMNSDYNLTFELPMTSDDYTKAQPKGHVQDERGQYYVINDRSRKRDGLERMVQFECMHVMFKLTDFKFPYASYIEEAYGVNIVTLLNSISSATGGKFTFSVDDTFDLKDVKDFGRGNCLEALNKVIEIYGGEIEPNNFTIHFKKQTGMDRGYQARLKKNIININFKDSSRALVTRLFSQMKDGRTFIGLSSSNLTTEEYALLNAVPGAIVGGVIRVNYLISPYVGYWSNTTNTYFDGEIINQDIEDPLELLKATRLSLREQEVPAIDVDLNIADLHRIDDEEPEVHLGDTIRIFDSEMQINDISARVMDLKEPLFNPAKQPSFTLANYFLRDYDDIIADLDKSKQIVDRIISGGKVVTSAFENFAAQAVNDINNSKSEVIYDDRGIVLRSKIIPNDIVVVSSKGIYVSRDNGVTAAAAITAEGVMGNKIVGVIGNFAQIEIGVGNNVFKANQAGIHLGHQNFLSSPFRVDMGGHAVLASAEVTGLINALGGTFSGNIIAYGTITGGVLIGALIQTSASYPRTEFSSTGNLLGAFYDANNSIRIVPNSSLTGTPGFEFYRGGVLQGRIQQLLGGMSVSVPSSGYFYIQGGSLFVTDVNNITDGITTIGQLLNTKATKGAATNLNGGHNHGFPDGTQFVDKAGNTHTWSVAAPHAHNQS
jgi:phage minor structural protein